MACQAASLLLLQGIKQVQAPRTSQGQDAGAAAAKGRASEAAAVVHPPLPTSGRWQEQSPKALAQRHEPLWLLGTDKVQSRSPERRGWSTVPSQTDHSLSWLWGHSFNSLSGPPLLQLTCAQKRNLSFSVWSSVLKCSWHSYGCFQRKRFTNLGMCYLSTPCCTQPGFLP